MGKLYITDLILEKLRDKHNLTEQDVRECFANRDGKSLIDIRDKHATDPKTQWFIARNNMGKRIKVVFMMLPDGRVLIKTAYLANPIELDIYNRLGAKDAS